MKAIGVGILLCYALNFGVGYAACYRAKEKAAPFCQKIISEARGWMLIPILITVPGEVNACLDFGYFPLTVPPYVSQPAVHQ